MKDSNRSRYEATVNCGYPHPVLTRQNQGHSFQPARKSVRRQEWPGGHVSNLNSAIRRDGDRKL